jgi:hypothetical protein
MRLADLHDTEIFQALLEPFDGFDNVAESLERWNSSGRSHNMEPCRLIVCR